MRISYWSSDVCSSDLTFPKIATAPRRQDIFKRQRAIAYGHHGVGLIRERGMITGSKISTPIHLDMILRSQRAIFGHRSYEHQLLFEEQFRDDTGPARCGIQDRRVKRTILNALHQAVSGIDMPAHGDFRAFPPQPEQPMPQKRAP